MERRKAEELGSVIMRYLRLQGLEAPLNEYRLIEAWPTVAGSAVAAYTDSLRIYNQKLYVKLKSPALRANLMMERGRAQLERSGGRFRHRGHRVFLTGRQRASPAPSQRSPETARTLVSGLRCMR